MMKVWLHDLAILNVIRLAYERVVEDLSSSQMGNAFQCSEKRTCLPRSKHSANL